MVSQTITSSVMVVDDTAQNLSVIISALADTYHVKVATSGPQALRLCELGPLPDVILLDIMMPGMDGIEVCRRLKANALTRGIPVIFVTAMTDARDETIGLQAGAADYITKPIRPAVVRQRVRLQLELRHAQQSQARLERHYKAYMSNELASGIQSGEVPSGVVSRRRPLTVFFSDIVGFTEQTENMDPWSLATLLNDYFDAMNEVVGRHHGTLDKFIGDACMVFFGDPTTRGVEEDALSCVRMALEMQERVALLQPSWKALSNGAPLQVRMGIASGACAVGNFGSKRRLTYTVLGTPVNLASRFEGQALPGSVLIAQETHDLVRSQFVCEPQPLLFVKGIARPLRTFVVTGRGAHRQSNSPSFQATSRLDVDA